MGWQEAADAVISRRVELGMRTRKQLADASGLTVKTLGEIERADRTSYDPATLALVERTLLWPAGTIAGVVAGKPAPTGLPTKVEVPPPVTPYRTPVVVSDLSALLHPKSKLSDAAKRAVTDAVEQVIERAHQVFVEGPADAAFVDQLMASMERDPMVPSTGRFLDALARGDSQLHPEDRKAIRASMNALLRLGQQALLAYDAQQREEREQPDEIPVPPREVKARDRVR